MSNAYLSAGGVEPGDGPIFTITGTTGGAESPDSNGNFNLLAATSPSFSNDGIIVVGSTNTETITLTNLLRGQVSTTDATPTAIITFSLGATAAVYSFAGVVTGISSSGDGCSYFLQSCVKTSGAAATEIGTEDNIFFEDSSLTTCDAVISASGNNFVVTVTGVAATDLNWDASFQFRRVI